MSEPIIEQIRQNVLDTVALVTTGNGFNYTLAVQSLARHGNDADDLTAIVEQGEEDVVDDDSGMGSNLADTQHQEFWVFVHVSTEAGVNYDQKCNRIVADVRKKMMADVYRGGLANWTGRKKYDFFQTKSGEVGGVIIPFTVCYRTRQDNPYSQ